MREEKLLIIAVLLLLLTAGCNRGEEAARGGGVDRGGQMTSVEVLEITPSSISDQIRSYGTIRPQDVVRITPQVSHRITEMYVDLGDTVEAGQLMARIHDRPFREELEQARAQYRQSRSVFRRDSTQYARQQQLYETAAISSSEYEEARGNYESSLAQFESARAAMEQSRENLENTEIRAPVNGVVLNRSAAVGDVAGTGEAIFEVANTAGYETRLWLPMRDWSDVQTGMPVELSLSGSDGVVAEGAVSRISPGLDPESGLGEVVVTLTSTGPGIRQGALVSARITLVTHEQTVVVPRSSILEQVETYIEPETNTVELRHNYRVFVARGDTVAERRDVTLGLQQGERVELVSGIEPGEKLIVTGQRSLSDGAAIRVPGRGDVPRDESRPGEGSALSGENSDQSEAAPTGGS